MNKNKERKFLLGSLGPVKCVSWPVAFKDFAWVKLCKGSWSREKWWASVKVPWPTPLCYLTLSGVFLSPASQDTWGAAAGLWERRGPTDIRGWALGSVLLGCC